MSGSGNPNHDKDGRFGSGSGPGSGGGGKSVGEMPHPNAKDTTHPKAGRGTPGQMQKLFNAYGVGKKPGGFRANKGGTPARMGRLFKQYGA